MSKYFINDKTAIVLDSVVYVLVREKKPSSNEVCGNCALYAKCWQDNGILRFCGICTPENGEQSWFFMRHRIYTKKGSEDLVKMIYKCFTQK